MIRIVQNFIRAAVLAVFAIFFIKLHITDDITKYINPKYNGMSKIAAGVFILFFFIQLFRVWEKEEDSHAHCSPGCTHDHGESGSLSKRLMSYGILIFPLLTGFAFAPTVLDSSIAAKKGTILPQVNRNEKNGIDNAVFENHPPGSQEEQEVLPNNNFYSEEEYNHEIKKLENSEVIQLNDRIYSSYVEAMNMNPKDFEGRKIKVSGFVYKEEGLEENQLVLSRFLITHCIADASITGLITEFDQANEFEEDTWLEIEGTLEVTNYNGIQLPLIKAEKWTVIQEPAEPYIYPILIKSG
ncbi:TIGR03943 family putative permease subunit [Niallia sp. Krafla_26]|uniref:TIGR03943 family putative permease subunit n=1 Tax=Niallia sp. Krafla_26 TaxID=3064703 RepID=UPI003D17A7DC